jgi:hypothetical protein
VSKSQELYDFAVEVVAETDLAIKCSNGEHEDAWFPLSQIQVERKSGRYATIVVPAWLAEKREWT